MIESRLWRIDIFLESMIDTLQYSSAKGNRLARERMIRKDDSSVEAAGRSALWVFAIAQTHAIAVILRRVEQDLALVAFGKGAGCEIIFRIEGIAKMEASYSFILQASFAEIGEADALSLVGAKQIVLESLLCKLVCHQHAFASCLTSTFLVGHLSVFNLDAIFIAEPLDCFEKRDLLMFHQELHRTTALAAAEAFAYVLGWRDIE